MQEHRGILSGVRILEMGTMLAGPVAATLLADFGAEVIKLEPPEKGDPIRHQGQMVDGESLYWNVEGRNKKSVTLDARTEKGQELVRKLVKECDVLVQNFLPGTMEKWNLGYERLREINPRLIMLSVSGFGQTGPNAHRACYDRVALAFSGFLYMTGYPDKPPVRPGAAVADYQTALFGAFSVMLALFNRDARGGSGQMIDISLYESVLRFTDTMIIAYDKLGVMRERRGNAHWAAAPGDHYETADGRFLALTVSADNVFRRLAESMGQSELSTDERFATHLARVTNHEVLNSKVADWIKSRPTEGVIAAFDAQSVPYSMIYSVKDIMKDPHYAARGSIATVDNPRIGQLKMQAAFPIMSETPAPPLRPAPTLGEHTDEVLSELLGIAGDQITELRKEKII